MQLQLRFLDEPEVEVAAVWVALDCKERNAAVATLARLIAKAAVQSQTNVGGKEDGNE